MTSKMKRHLMIASLVTLLPVPAAFFLNAPAGMQAHVRSFAWASVALLLSLWLCAWLTLRDPGNKGRNEKPLALMLWVIPIISILCSVYVWAAAMGCELGTTGFLIPMGLLFSAIGNYLPKCRMNRTMGIKVSWAYTSEENWAATHRFGGKLWFVGGILMALTALLPAPVAIGAFIILTAVMIVLPTVYSYRYYKMQKARGDELLPFPKAFGSKKSGIISIVTLVVILAAVVVLLFTGNIRYSLEADHLAIQPDYYSDDTLNYADIATIEYREENIPGYRVGGFGSFRLLMGFFRNDEFGNYVRYTYYDPDACIVVTTQDGTMVLSAETAEQTHTLYEELLQKTSK